MRLHDYLDFHGRLYPDAEFAVFGERRLSYAEALRATHRIANAFVSAGLQPGDRIAILAKNSPEFVLLYYGAFRAGVVPVPLNYRLAPPEWEYILRDAGAKLLVARGEYVSQIEATRAALPDIKTAVAIGAAPPSGWAAWDDWLAGQPDAPCGRHIAGDTDAYQMYTSGTTGRPKGAVLTHRAVSANLTQLNTLHRIRIRPGERYLIVAPVYHAAAAVACFWTVSQGGSLYIQEDFLPAEAVRALAREQIVGATLVPAMIQAVLVMVPDVAAHRYEALRFMVYGASPIAEETLRRAMEVFSCDFAQGYGMTETTAALTFLVPEDHHRALREKPQLLLSAGRALLGTEVRVVDPEGKPVPTGAIGEIAARGPQLMRGYWNLPEATAEALRGGWMHTGDAGVIDEEGYIYLQDRVKDMIVSGGENVYPREIENVLFQHPAVADVAVIGVPDERWGETVKAIVVARQGRMPTAEELIDFCRDKLAGYKRPRSVDFLPALPRNPSGKVLKRELREPYWEGQRRRIS
jgi:fatty-acyl-CoA synthase